MTSLLTTGLSGLVGSKLLSTFGDAYTFENLDINHPTEPTDITNYDSVMTQLSNNDANFIVHFAAFTDVTAAWQQSGDTTGIAYKVNVTGTENLVKAAASTGKHLIHISTAFVFDGEKETPYTEADAMHPIEWYGQTKALAEEAVQASSSPWTILRIDFPFRSDVFPRPDIVRKTIANLELGRPLFNDHHFGPTFIDDFVKVIDWAIRTKATGLYHASAGESWSDYEFGQTINDLHHLGYDVKHGSLTEYLKTTNRPYQRNTAMDCSKLQKALDFSQLSVKDALSKVVIAP